MTFKLRLGENEVPYDNDPRKTTVQVAEILEAHYALFSTFAEYKESEISEALAEGMAERLETLLGGAPGVSADPFEGVGAGVENLFREFLITHEAEGVVPGTPTGVAKRKGRPSFIDTSLMMENFRAWVEEV